MSPVWDLLLYSEARASPGEIQDMLDDRQLYSEMLGGRGNGECGLSRDAMAINMPRDQRQQAAIECGLLRAYLERIQLSRAHSTRNERVRASARNHEDECVHVFRSDSTR